MSIIEDVKRRSAHIHWPQGIVPEQADLFAHNDILIAAPPGGETDQWLACRTWLLEPPDEATTYVVMQETGAGANPKKLARSNPGHMRRGHDLWNISLKFPCEGAPN
jgi:hypothetical protein